MFTSMIKAIIFDCFGVLVVDALGAILNELRVSDSAKADKIIAILDRVIRNKIPVRESQVLIADLLDMDTDAYIEYLQSGQVRNTMLLDYIAELKKDYKTAMLSNVSNNGLAKLFTDAELEAHFDVVVASGNIGFAKPEARAYEITADQLGVRLDECVMIDDRDEYCEGAAHVGMHVIKYENFDQMQQGLTALLVSNA